MDSDGLAQKEKWLVKLATRLAIIINTRIKSHYNHVLEKLTINTQQKLTSSRLDSLPVSISQIERPKELAFGNSHMHDISGIYFGEGPSVHYDFDNDTSLLDSQRLSQILRQSTLNRDESNSNVESDVSSKKITYNTYANQLKVNYGKKYF